MANPRYEDLASAKRRRLVLQALLRPLATATLLVALYYLLPMDRRWSARGGDWPRRTGRHHRLAGSRHHPG